MPYPTYWFRPQQQLGSTTGHHRFVWDLRHTPPPGTERSYAIAAVLHNTPPGPDGPFVHPGKYTIRLNVDGTVLQRQIEVMLDPRVQIPAEDLQLQTDYSMACYTAYLRLQTLRDAIEVQLKENTLNQGLRDRLSALRGSGKPSGGDILYGSIYDTPTEQETVVGLQEKFLYMLHLLQTADVRPTPQAMESVQKLQESLGILGKKYAAMR